MIQKLSIKDLENLSGVKAHTIRIWEKRYNLFNPERTGTNIRFYDHDDLKKLLNVTSILEDGLKISKICSLSDAEINNKIVNLQSHNTLISKHIVVNQLVLATLNCDISLFENVYNELFASEGMEHTIENVIYPLLIKIGVMWSVSKLNPAQEHFASQMIRQKLFTAIDALPYKKSKEKYVLYLPEHEHHEIGLLYAYYLLKKAGNECIYLGPNVPIIDAATCANSADATKVLCMFTIKYSENQLSSYLNKMKANFENQQILFSGICGTELMHMNRKSCTFLHEIQDLKNEIA